MKDISFRNALLEAGEGIGNKLAKSYKKARYRKIVKKSKRPVLRLRGTL